MTEEVASLIITVPVCVLREQGLSQVIAGEVCAKEREAAGKRERKKEVSRERQV